MLPAFHLVLALPVPLPHTHPGCWAVHVDVEADLNRWQASIEAAVPGTARTVDKQAVGGGAETGLCALCSGTNRPGLSATDTVFTEPCER